MKDIKLLEISFTDYKGHSNKLEINEKNALICGRNKSGKSIILSAWLWLLTGADEFNRTNFNIFDTKLESTYENKQTAIVTARIKVNGEEYTLKKTAIQVWTRPRGKEEYIRSGDTYEYLIDGIKRSATDYAEWIKNMFLPIDQLKCIINIKHFLSLEWKEQRKMLELMSGSLEQSDFIKHDYSSVFELLKKYSIEDAKLKIKSEINPLNKAKDEIPIRMEALKQALPDISNLAFVEQQISCHEDRIKEIDGLIAKSDESLAPIIKKREAMLEEAEAKKQAMYNASNIHTQQYNAQYNEVRSRLEYAVQKNKSIEDENKSKASRKKTMVSSLVIAKEQLKKALERRSMLLDELHVLKASMFNDNENKCRLCGQELPKELLEQKISYFNEDKADKIKKINTDGLNNKDYIANIESSIKQMEQDIDTMFIPSELTDISTIEDELSVLSKNYIDFQSTDRYKELKKEYDEYVATIPNYPHNSDKENLIAEKNGIMNEIGELYKKTALREQHDNLLTSIQTLKTDLAKNGSELAKLEGIFDLITAYEEERANLVRERVQKYFDRVTISMYKLDKSNNVVPTCELYVNGAKDSVFNGAEYTMSGIDISNAFSKFYNVSMPVFIDDRERVDDNAKIECIGQTIQLKRSDEDMKLTLN